MPSVKPALRAALVTQLRTALAPQEVRYGGGFTDTQTPGAVMIGTTDPFDAEDTVIDESVQEARTTGQRRKEEGDLRCATLYWTGNPGEAGAQQAYEGAYALTAGVETYLKTNPNLQDLVPGLISAEYGTEETAREGDLNGQTCVVLQFTIHFEARI
jgi:hypothetical protein